MSEESTTHQTSTSPPESTSSSPPPEPDDDPLPEASNRETASDDSLNGTMSLNKEQSILSHGIPMSPFLPAYVNTPFHSSLQRHPYPPKPELGKGYRLQSPLHPLHLPFHLPAGPHPDLLTEDCSRPHPPLCSLNTTKPWCLTDFTYPIREIQSAIQSHKVAILEMYADVADLATQNSVVRPRSLYEETYLCPSETSYVRPLRAVNTKGFWRIVVNNVNVDYDVFTQTTRLEECFTNGKSCSLVPSCYNSKCVQKSVYHRFLIYDPCDPILPFAIETFRLPASCSCIVGEIEINY